jgi:monoamine oxidase
VQSGPGRFWTWTAADQTGQVQPVLHAFSGTEAGLAALAVSFAGEHTAAGWAGLMEGALRSGARAAAAVLAHARC